MDYFTLLIITTTLLLALLRRRRRRISASARPPPPSPPGLPIIGHLHLLTDMPHHSLAALAAGGLGPLFALRLGRVPTAVVSSARLAGLVLRAHDHVFASRPQLVSAQYISFGCSDVTFSRHGPYWRQARKICVSELLSPRRVSSFRVVRDEETGRMVSRLMDRSGSATDVSEAVFTVANDVLCRVAFGRRFIRGEGQKRHLLGVLAEAQELFGGFCAGDFFPEWGWVNSLTGFKRRCESNLEDLRAVCDEIIAEHARQTPSFEREDFVDVLRRVQRRPDLDVPITDDNLKALVLVR